MEKYIVITEYGEQKQDITVESISCKNKNNLLLCWARRVSYPRIGIKSKQKLRREILFHCNILNSSFVLVNGTQNLYTDLYIINGIFIAVYAIKVRRLIEVSNSYVILGFYKTWGIMAEKILDSPLDALNHFLAMIPWKEFSQEEKNEFEKVQKSTSHVNCVIRNLVWNFECSILGNSLKVYIVKS